MEITSNQIKDPATATALIVQSYQDLEDGYEQKYILFTDLAKKQKENQVDIAEKKKHFIEKEKELKDIFETNRQKWDEVVQES